MLFFERDIAMDIGTASSQVFVQGKGITLRRASEFFRENFRTEWVYDLDGGQSFALMSRKPGKKRMVTIATGGAKIADIMAFTE